MRSGLLFALSCMMASVLGAPYLSKAKFPDGTLTVVDPMITSPTQTTVWVVGNKYNVTWCAQLWLIIFTLCLQCIYRSNANLPPLVDITNVQGEIVLGQFNGDGEHLFIGKYVREICYCIS
jgi:hypothetical protein